ncbi:MULTISPECIES: ATP-binding cassette domain-containing protein [unclassified Janthinobacterium]|uniref:ATP-binding cassette domain-containing protein n=1 Tax=unclassified Janthinobacterium TaxID=2610881 RepID=UPI001619E00D|nr:MULTISPECIES: ATP-binding cassette domain-containing protein [unclassified Janthinobacterium]MBB5371203.1 ATPase subunit of ABC transporter with duplicated ATPase domains [Janthinobacterium sp. K2C7]MBB5384009.1 ATPase subunit of ABC transporter with duplicated ATPase domains [Janthinobacterium sp. K2Li3]MBB5389169.1 ATPase subunit of ABC transporter with duplicated ATPase domains [Janthinobacterium sp. K2E3]
MSAVLQLDRLSHVLPDGRTLFSDLQFTFAPHRIGLVGDNGVGKSVLGRLLAGQHGGMHYVPQDLAPEHYPTVAALAGVATVLAALSRIADGSLDPDDYALVGDRWDAATRLRQALDEIDLPHVGPDTATVNLSGGERQRIALQGAWLSQADWLLLDEPSNHLDAQQRGRLLAQMGRWPRGLLLISHDRSLLVHVDEIVELSAQGLRSYGGNYDFYAQQRALEQAGFAVALQSEKAGARRARREAQQQAERQQKRVSRGEREGREGNQSKLLLDAKKEKSQASQGRLRLRAQQAEQERRIKVMEASARCAPDAERLLLAPDSVVPNGKLMLELSDLVLPHGSTQPLNLILSGPCRLAVRGDNGSGKSTLLRVIAGQLAPASGELRCHARLAWLDQHAGGSDGGLSAIARLQARNSLLSEGELRTRLALLGINGARATVPSRLLSGGERMKVALAAELYAQAPPQLLLLDEPDNHLDLASLQALAQMLRLYRGALLVVSHDQAFLQELLLDDGSIHLLK